MHIQQTHKIKPPTHIKQQKGEWEILSGMIDHLIAKDTYHKISFTKEKELPVLQKIVKWPNQYIVFVLDFFRALVLHPSLNPCFCFCFLFFFVCFM